MRSFCGGIGGPGAHIWHGERIEEGAACTCGERVFRDGKIRSTTDAGRIADALEDIATTLRSILTKDGARG